MSETSSQPAAQGAPFQRFTVRLVDGRFVRVPKSDLPSMEASRQTAASNQPALRDLFRLVNGRFIVTRPDPTAPVVNPDLPLPAQQGPDPTFDLPA